MSNGAGRWPTRVRNRVFALKRDHRTWEQIKQALLDEGLIHGGRGFQARTVFYKYEEWGVQWTEYTKALALQMHRDGFDADIIQQRLYDQSLLIHGEHKKLSQVVLKRYLSNWERQQRSQTTSTAGSSYVALTPGTSTANLSRRSSLASQQSHQRSGPLSSHADVRHPRRREGSRHSRASSRQRRPSSALRQSDAARLAANLLLSPNSNTPFSHKLPQTPGNLPYPQSEASTPSNWSGVGSNEPHWQYIPSNLGRQIGTTRTPARSNAGSDGFISVPVRGTNDTNQRLQQRGPTAPQKPKPAVTPSRANSSLDLMHVGGATVPSEQSTTDFSPISREQAMVNLAKSPHSGLNDQSLPIPRLPPRSYSDALQQPIVSRPIPIPNPLLNVPPSHSSVQSSQYQQQNSNASQSRQTYAEVVRDRPPRRGYDMHSANHQSYPEPIFLNRPTNPVVGREANRSSPQTHHASHQATPGTMAFQYPETNIADAFHDEVSDFWCAADACPRYRCGHLLSGLPSDAGSGFA